MSHSRKQPAGALREWPQPVHHTELMQTRTLGNSGLEITPIGFGAAAIGGPGWEYGWGPQDDRDSVNAILKSLELGVNWIDTAAAYGCGHSEEIVRKALAEWKGRRPSVFTKCGLGWDDKGKIQNVLSANSLRRECEESLRRLGTETIDLYQIHWPPSTVEEIDPVWEMMAELKREGKVRYIGVSNFDIPLMKRCLSIAPVSSLQPRYSLVYRDMEEEVLPFCQREGTGVIVYSPMESGLLSGGMTRERVKSFPEDDWRRLSEDFREPKLSRSLALAERLKQIGRRHGRSAGEVAIAWTLRHPAVTGAIVGARSAEQAEGVMRAADCVLTQEELDEIEKE